MKRSLLFLTAICFFIVYPANAQVGRLVNKAKQSVVNQVIGSPQEDSNKNSSAQPEPACACDNADLILDLGGKFKLDYSEMNINILDDGSIVIHDKLTSKYYISKDGITNGPYEENDPRLNRNSISGGEDKDKNPFLPRYKDYISKSGDKYLITFNGKSYGPYGQINNFAVTRSKDKFAAVVVQNVLNSEDDAKKMEEAMNNAKTDQEKMDLAMKYSQQMQQKMMAGGGPQNSLPKFITNVAGATYDPTTEGGTFSADMKYDEILVNRFNEIYDLKGNKLITIKPEYAGSTVLINSENTKYAAFTYGALTYSDGTTMSDLFNPHLVK